MISSVCTAGLIWAAGRIPCVATFYWITSKAHDRVWVTRRIRPLPVMGRTSFLFKTFRQGATMAQRRTN